MGMLQQVWARLVNKLVGVVHGYFVCVSNMAANKWFKV
jgi:hypothetical protein